MMAFQTASDQFFFSKLYQSTKSVLGMEKDSWSCQEIIRFLSLIKVQSKLQTFFYEFKITGELLFDPKYLWQKMVSYLEAKTYFPIMKLLHIVLKFSFLQKKNISNIQFVIPNQLRSPSKTNVFQKQQKCRWSTTTQSKNQKNLQKYQTLQSLSYEKKGVSDTFDPEENQQQNVADLQLSYLNVEGEILVALQNQFLKIAQIVISDLSSNQIVKIFKSTEIQRAIYLSELIKKYSIDGYCIIFLLSNREVALEQIRRFFTKEEIDDFQCILNLILPFYFKQIIQTSQKNQQLVSPNKFNFQLPVDFQSLAQSTNLKQSFGKSQYGTSQIYGQSEAGSQIISQLGTSEYQNQGMGIRTSTNEDSIMGRSECGNSIYEKSQFGNSQYAFSQYAVSERGSVRNSYAQSIMGESLIFQNQYKAEKRKQVRVSSVEDVGINLKLKQVALNLPFNLFKMDPLQKIKVTTLNYPFTLNFQKPKTHEQFVRSLKSSIEKIKSCSANSSLCSKQFNITGVKFGRSQQNDFRYPDQLSISGKHAQISFWNNKYQLFDLQSKTGTFLYIPLTRPLILKDQHIIQLSNQIQIIVHILKKDATQGSIKLQFTKPQNQPFYKASLKEGQTLKIGRSQKCHIKLCQQSISSKHTQIKYQNKQFKIYDCLSSTGTWLRLSKKGVKSENFALQQGDIIRISSKRTYLIQSIKNSLEQDDQFEQLQGLLQNPNFKIIRENSEQHFNQIVANTWKRKTPYQKNSQYCNTQKLNQIDELNN